MSAMLNKTSKAQEGAWQKWFFFEKEMEYPPFWPEIACEIKMCSGVPPKFNSVCGSYLVLPYPRMFTGLFFTSTSIAEKIWQFFLAEYGCEAAANFSTSCFTGNRFVMAEPVAHQKT